MPEDTVPSLARSLARALAAASSVTMVLALTLTLEPEPGSGLWGWLVVLRPELARAHVVDLGPVLRAHVHPLD